MLEAFSAQVDLNKTEGSHPFLSPGQQLHLSSLTYRNLAQREAYDRYLNNSLDDLLQ